MKHPVTLIHILGPLAIFAAVGIGWLALGEVHDESQRYLREKNEDRALKKRQIEALEKLAEKGIVAPAH